MDYSYERRSNIRKARARDPIVSVFLHDNPKKCLSIQVPSSKSWTEFINKIQSKFELASDSKIIIFQSPIDRDDDSIVDLEELHEYDTNDTDMAKIKHKWNICVQVIQSNDNNNNNTQNRNQSKSTKSSKRSKKNKRKNKNKNRTSDSNNSSSSSSNDNNNNDLDIEEERKEQQKQTNNYQNEHVKGVDLDIFGRSREEQKLKQFSQLRKKNRKKNRYHMNLENAHVDFNIKRTWKSLQKQAMSVEHENEKYTILTNKKDNEFSIRTRRMIWPCNLQNESKQFDFKFSAMQKWKWAILIIHGGKFAGAIYRGNELILHKTLSRYVTRKKQGKRQSNHLSSSGVKGGSAGGYKRACNEKKLLEEIHEIISNWMDELITCQKIFIHCPGLINQNALYGSNEEQMLLYPCMNNNNNKINMELSKQRLNEVRNKNKNKYQNLFRLYKKDKRIQQIPIATHGVTLSEVERVHYWLSNCWLSKNIDANDEQEYEDID